MGTDKNGLSVERKVLAVMAGIMVLVAIIGLVRELTDGDHQSHEVTYNAANADVLHAQDQIADWLGGPDTAERELLRSWLVEQGIKGSEALWLVSASQDELNTAIGDLHIPECDGVAPVAEPLTGVVALVRSPAVAGMTGTWYRVSQDVCCRAYPETVEFERDGIRLAFSVDADDTVVIDHLVKLQQNDSWLVKLNSRTAEVVIFFDDSGCRIEYVIELK